MQLAESLNRAHIPHVESVEVAGPGFVNFRLHDTWLHEVLREVVESGVDGYAKPDIGQGERVMIEFVSANPTGPLHVGNGWFASYGDALAPALRAHRSRGHPRVLRERHRRPGPALRCEHPGSQARPARSRGRLSRSVRRGPRRSSTTGPTTLLEAGRWGGERVLEDIRTTLESINIHYDEWYSQASIEESGAVAETIEVLRGKGLIFDRERCDLAAHRRLRRPARGARADASRTATSPIWVATSPTTATSS